MTAYFRIPYRTHCHFRYKTFLSRHGSDCRVNSTGAAPHVGRQITESFNSHCPNFWIDRFGPHAWRARSPDPSPLYYFLWGVHEGGHGRYSKKITDPRYAMLHLTLEYADPNGEMTKLSERQQIIC